MDLLKTISDLETVWKSNDPFVFKGLRWSREEFEAILQSDVFRALFPEKEIDRKFRGILKPFIFERGEKTVFCRYTRDHNDNSIETEISALTTEMIEADKLFFYERTAEKNALDLIYKPYTYELSFDEKLSERFYHDYEENTWYEVVVRKYEEKEPGKVYGRLCYGASPLDYQTVEIEWTKKIATVIPSKQFEITQDDIDNYYNAQKPDLITGWLDWLFNNNQSRLLLICRVGQANAVLGINELASPKENRRFAFDVGLPNDNNIKWSGASVDRKISGLHDEGIIELSNPNVVFISHWHTDHFKGAFILPRNVYTGKNRAMWIAPYYKVNGKNNNANRLVAYLVETGQIAFVGDVYSYSKNNIALFRVKTSDPSDLNNDCILLQLNSTLLPGDCFYENWPTNYGMQNNIKNLIISHHASKSSCSVNTESKLRTIFKNGTNKAYVCVGMNDWGHPDGGVIDMFSDAGRLGFDVISTLDCNRQKMDFVIHDL